MPLSLCGCHHPHPRCALPPPQVRNRFHFRYARWQEVLDGATSHQTKLMLDEARNDNLSFAAKSKLSSAWARATMEDTQTFYTEDLQLQNVLASSDTHRE